jgi:uncharacterized protein (DUF2164 family)
MALASFTKAEKEAIVAKIQKYFAEELDQEIGAFDAGFLLNFFTEEIGPYFYNLALRDSQAVLSRRMDDINNAIDELVKPTGSKR